MHAQERINDASILEGSHACRGGRVIERGQPVADKLLDPGVAHFVDTVVLLENLVIGAGAIQVGLEWFSLKDVIRKTTSPYDEGNVLRMGEVPGATQAR